MFHSVHSAKNKQVTHVLPLYVFDERFIELSGLPGYERTGPEARTRLFGFWRTGVFRARSVSSGAESVNLQGQVARPEDAFCATGKDSRR